MIKPGQLVFFDQGSPSTKQRAPKFRWKGHGFGIFLGVTPPFGREPNDQELLSFMAMAGFVRFDQYAALMGEDSYNELMNKIKEHNLKTIEELKRQQAEESPLIIVAPDKEIIKI